MVAEAAEASQVVRRQLAWWAASSEQVGEFLRDAPPRLIVTVARGSSDHAATYAKYLIELETGIPVASFAPSIASVYDAGFSALNDVLFLAISQSGRSSDLIAAARSNRGKTAGFVSIVNDEKSELARLSDLVIPQCAENERSVAATKTFIASQTAILQLTALLARNVQLEQTAASLPELLDRSWHLAWDHAAATLADAASMYVIGRGSTLGIAQEAALKFKEVCGIHAEAFSAAEVRHGPMELIGAGFPILMFVPQDQAAVGFETLARELVARGAKVIVAGADLSDTIALPILEGMASHVAPICMIASFYKLAAAISLCRGRDPDRPHYLTKVTDTL